MSVALITDQVVTRTAEHGKSGDMYFLCYVYPDFESVPAWPLKRVRTG